MHKYFLSFGAIFAALAVVLGAFGAHTLKKMLPPEIVSSFQTGVQYQMYHAFALLLTGVLFEKMNGYKTLWAGYCFIAGVVLFSGSLYLLTFLKVTGSVGITGIGMITPIGGLFLIAGWLFLLLSLWKK